MVTCGRFVAPGLLGAGAALSLASVPTGVWFVGSASRDHVQHLAKFTLWSRSSSVSVESPVSHGEPCQSSDECMEGLMCRHGDHRCWTDGDCHWEAYLTQTARDCAQLPRTATHVTWAELCKASSRDSWPCSEILLLRFGVILSAVLALLAAPCALHLAHLPALVGGSGVLVGLAAVLCAVTVELRDAEGPGWGFWLHCAGVGVVALGAAVAFSWRVTPEERDTAKATRHLTTRYGASFQSLGQEADGGDCGGRAPGAGGGAPAAVAEAGTLLQTLHGACVAGVGARAAKKKGEEKGEDLETGEHAVPPPMPDQTSEGQVP